MGDELAGEVVAVYVQVPALAAHAAVAALVPPRHAEPAALVADEAVEGYPPAGAEPERDLLGHLELAGGGAAGGLVLLRRHAGDGAPPPSGLLRAPQGRVLVEGGDVGEVPAREEVALHEPDQPLDLALGEGVSRLAEPGAEADAPHELRVVALPDWPAVEVAPDHDGPHVVREHLAGDPHGHEGVDHPYEQVLLARVGEELDVGAAAVVAHHGEARHLVLGAVQSDDRDEAPVHLVRLTGPGHEALPAAPLRRDRPSPCGDQVHVGGYVDLDAREAATISLADQPLVDHLRVGDAPPGQVVHKAGVSGGHGGPGLPAGVAMREHLRPWPLMVLALDLVNPVLRQRSARLHACGSNPPPASAAISSSALPMISCRSSRLSFTSIVLLTPAHWQNQLRWR